MIYRGKVGRTHFSHREQAINSAHASDFDQALNKEATASAVWS